MLSVHSLQVALTPLAAFKLVIRFEKVSRLAAAVLYVLPPATKFGTAVGENVTPVFISLSFDFSD